MSRRRLIPVSLVVLSGSALAWATGCSDNSGNGDAGGSSSSSSGSSSSGSGSGSGSSSSGSGSGSGSSSSGSGSGSGSSSSSSSSGAGDAGSFVKIDDMEGTGNGPIELTGYPAGKFPGYWYDGVSAGDPRNTVTPAKAAYGYSPLPAPHMTMPGVTSAHGAHVACPIWDQYGFCQEAFEFAQANNSDAGPPADAAPDATFITPRTTVPFDISAYNGITFWVMAGANMSPTASIRVLFPDIDSDPRGNRCGVADAGQCYDSWSYAIPTSMVTTSWTQVTIPYAPAGGVLAVQNFGFEAAQFDPAHVYGVTFQVSGPQAADAGAAVNADYWIDDIYFTK